MLGCLVLSSGCGGVAGGTGGADNEIPGTGPTTTQPATSGETLAGTEGEDRLRGGEGEDVVRGLGGNDEVYGGGDRDRLYGGSGDDVIDAQDPGSVGETGRDGISCGPGRDEVLMDANDGERPRDCEMVTEGAS